MTKKKDPLRMILPRRFSPAELAVIAALSGADEDEGWMSHAEIRERSGAGAAAVSRAKATLLERGLAEEERSRARPGPGGGRLDGCAFSRTGCWPGA